MQCHIMFELVHDSQVSGLVLVLCPFVFAWLVLSQVLVLAHVAPDVEPLSPVIAYRLRPAPVLALYSRTARIEPRCQPKHAVFHAWKDCAACFVVRDPAGIFSQDQFARKLWRASLRSRSVRSQSPGARCRSVSECLGNPPEMFLSGPLRTFCCRTCWIRDTRRTPCSLSRNTTGDATSMTTFHPLRGCR